MTSTELTKAIRINEQIVDNDSFNKRLNEILKERKPQFVASVLNLIKTNHKLAECDPMTIWNAAIVAATLDLPIDPNLGFAYIIPYGAKAQFQIGYKGVKQLAHRTRNYKYIHATDVREGELIGRNRLTGELNFEFIENDGERLAKQIIGYVSYFETHDGFSHSLYMSIDELIFHATKYSKSYQNDLKCNKSESLWSDIDGGGFGKMCEKTVTKLNLSKNGILSIQLQQAIKSDGRVINDNGEPENSDEAELEGKPPKELEDLEKLNNTLEANINSHEAEKQPETVEPENNGGNGDDSNQ